MPPALTQTTKTPASATFNSLELFSGAGGLALGIAQAGFDHVAVIEQDDAACQSLRANVKALGVSAERVREMDAREYDFSRHAGSIDLLAAGAPCQPFSVGGKHRGHADERNMLPVVLDAVRKIMPRAVLIENVPGLARPAMRRYLGYVEKRLAFLDHRPKRGERWQSHLRRLDRHAASPRRQRPADYIVEHVELNAADFGMPQKRRRLFIVATRADLACDWDRLRSLILPTHSQDALLFAKWIDGSYWAQHSIPVYDLPEPKPAHHAVALERLRHDGPPETARWHTVYDALRGTNSLMGWRPLLEPVDDEECPGITNHVGRAGARIYTGHTGSVWHEPAKALKAGSHGVPGGENAICLDDRSVRYFTVREAARLQGFPDDYTFSGAWTRSFKQLGNAVPVGLGRAVASAIHKTLSAATASAVIAAA